ncbi:MAG: NAD-dependent epimerase/dehydratase family protein [Gaiellaceae bacterium]
MKILVTGGAGFIGSHVVDRLVAQGHRARVFDLAYAKYGRRSEADHVLGDLLDLEVVRGAVRDCDAVVHLAAVSDVGIVADEPQRAERVNSGGTSVLLEAMRLEGIARIVYASTTWVYGDGPQCDPLDEDAPLPLPGHLYTATKLAGEMYCHTYSVLYGIEPTIARFGIPYGPRARPSTVLAAFVTRALGGKPLTITGDGTQSRRFVYVEDLAEGVVAALAPVAIGRTYNLVGDENTTVRQIADRVRDLVGYVPIVHVGSRAADLQGAEISGRRALDELGWRPETPFAEGARRYVAWVTGTNGKPREEAASITSGSAATVWRQEPAEL